MTTEAKPKCPHCGKEMDYITFCITETNYYSYNGDGSACWVWDGDGGNHEIVAGTCPHCCEEIDGMTDFDAVDALFKAAAEVLCPNTEYPEDDDAENDDAGRDDA